MEEFNILVEGTSTLRFVVKSSILTPYVAERVDKEGYGLFCVISLLQMVMLGYEAQGTQCLPMRFSCVSISIPLISHVQVNRLEQNEHLASYPCVPSSHRQVSPKPFQASSTLHRTPTDTRSTHTQLKKSHSAATAGTSSARRFAHAARTVSEC